MIHLIVGSNFCHFGGELAYCCIASCYAAINHEQQERYALAVASIMKARRKALFEG